MKEHPILFSAPMVRAILDGRKTQTRRVMKPQPVLCDGMWDWKDCQWMDDGIGFPASGIIDHSPYGVPGDRLWVWEAFCKCDRTDEFTTMCFRAEDDTCDDAKWTPSIHMPRWASRIILEVIGVRVESLQDISEKDAKAEGVESYSDDGVIYYGEFGKGDCRPDREFSRLWDSINAKRGFSWKSNPWVWVIEFERIKEADHV